MNPCIVSIFQDNVDMKTVGLQRSVVEKFNVNKYRHYQFKLNMPHGVAIDYFWATNGCVNAAFRQVLGDVEIPHSFDHDVVLILDIDCIPVSERAIDKYINAAAAGRLIGNAQRSNHLDNGQHLFAASSCAAISKETYRLIEMPSAFENRPRSDVLEEYTWAAEEHGIPVDLMMPLRYNEPPVRFPWEGEQPPYWALKDGMPVYGVGTTFGDDEGDLFYHQFQIFHADHQQKFWQKCESILAE